MSTASDPPAAGRAGLTGGSEVIPASISSPAVQCAMAEHDLAQLVEQRERYADDAHPVVLDADPSAPPTPAPPTYAAGIAAGPVKAAIAGPEPVKAIGVGVGAGGVVTTTYAACAFVDAKTKAQRDRALGVGLFGLALTGLGTALAKWG